MAVFFSGSTNGLCSSSPPNHPNYALSYNLTVSFSSAHFCYTLYLYMHIVVRLLSPSLSLRPKAESSFIRTRVPLISSSLPLFLIFSPRLNQIKRKRGNINVTLDLMQWGDKKHQNENPLILFYWVEKKLPTGVLSVCLYLWYHASNRN